MSSTPVVPVVAAPKVSWLKKFGQKVEQVLGLIAKDAVPVALAAGQVVSFIDPVLAPEITVAENLVSKIANQSLVTEAAFAAVGQASNGAAKLQAVLNAVGPEIAAWTASAFPGSSALSLAAQSGLINAVVAILNDIDPSLGLVTPTPSAVAAASAAVAASKAKA
jgi:hypothetical protein